MSDDLRGDVLWSQKSIAAYLGVSVDRVPVLVDEGAPVRKVGGQWASSRTALSKWFQDRISGKTP